MDIDKFKTNIQNFRDYADWCKWMAVINGRTEKWARRILKRDLIHGYCEDFAVYFCYKYDLPLYTYGHKHFLLFVDGVYYDGYNNRGVDNVLKLQFVKEECWHYYYTHGVKETFIPSPVTIDENWKRYQVFTDNFKLINKENQNEQ